MREKLVELLGSMHCGDFVMEGCGSCKYGCEDMCQSHAVADHLIANGVIIQKWVPASDPPKERFVLVATTDGIVGEACYMDGRFYWANTDEDAEAIEVTHWMPLPELPNMGTPNITEETKAALNRMGAKAHGGADNG